MLDISPSEPLHQAAPQAPLTKETEPAWPAVVSLSLGVFGLVTAEFLPASLLTPMANDLAITNGTAGQAVTATAVVAAFAAPAMAIVTNRIDRRLVLWTLTSILVFSNLLAANAYDLTTLLTARVLLGISLGGFWSMAAATAMRLVPMRLMPRAMSIVLTGVSVATVCAAPVGAYVGDLWGWRTAFTLAAGVGALALLVQMLTIPKLPPIGTASVSTLFRLMRRPSVSIALVAVLLIISGHFAGFTYIRPFLERVTQLDVATISPILLAYGIGGFIGNFAGGFVVERSVRAGIGIGAVAIAALSLALVMFGVALPVAAISVAVWGFAFGAFPVGFQTWIVRAAPDQAESAGGLLVAAFQVAIASGAIFGGLLVDGFGPAAAISYCGIAILLGGILVFAIGDRTTHQPAQSERLR